MLNHWTFTSNATVPVGIKQLRSFQETPPKRLDKSFDRAFDKSPRPAGV